MPKVYIVWGTDDVRKANEGEYEKMGNSPTEYKFLTEIELEAFLKGIEEAIGWMDYCTLDEPLMKICEQERNK